MRKQTDIAFLLMILILLSASIGILHGRKKVIDPTTIQDVPIILEHQDAIDYIQPYLMSGNMDLVGRIFHQFPAHLVAPVLKAILDNKTTHLLPDQKIQVLAAILLYDTDKNKEKEQMIAKQMQAYFAHYPLFIPLASYYAQAIPIILNWAAIDIISAQQRDVWTRQSLKQAIEKDDMSLLSGLYTAAIIPTKKQASELLYQVASLGKKASFIPFLINQLGADIAFSPDGKRTSLIVAVEQNHPHIVQALIKQGAQPEQILHPATGSALQIAFERGYTPIELILKKQK